MAAALAELAARFAADEAAVEEARRLRGRLVELGEEDARAYSEFMKTRSDEARARIVEVPLAIAEAADAVAALADRVAAVLRSAVVGDARTAGLLADAAARAARGLAELNA